MDFKNDRPYIFISYSHSDSDTVLPIFKKLRQNNVNIWYDEGVKVGTEWPEYIAQKIVDCYKVICFVSEEYQQSHNCVRELNFAVSQKKDVISVIMSDDVRLSPGIEMQLGTCQAMYFDRYKNRDDFCEILCKEDFIRECLTDTTPPPPPPPDKYRVLKRIAALLCLGVLLVSDYAMLSDAPFHIQKYSFAFSVAMCIAGIMTLFRACMCVGMECSRFRKWTIFLSGTAFAVLLNYAVCLPIMDISVWFYFWTVTLLIIVNLAIMFAESAVIGLMCFKDE